MEEERYVAICKIGEGTFGKVFKGLDRKTGATVAMKLIAAQETEKEDDPGNARGIPGNDAGISEKMCNSPEEEAALLGQLDHPNIIRCLHYQPGEQTALLVFEYADRGDLLAYLQERTERGQGGLSEAQARLLFGQLTDALNFMHDRGTIHLDVKLENIMLFSAPPEESLGLGRQLKLGDFGFSTSWSPDKKAVRRVGSLHYWSPEIARKQATYGPESDVWSAGVVLFAMVFGTLPLKFRDSKVEEEYKRVEQQGLLFPKTVSTELVDLLRRMLTVNPDKRATMREVRESAWARGASHLGAVSPQQLRLNLEKLNLLPKIIVSPKSSPGSAEASPKSSSPASDGPSPRSTDETSDASPKRPPRLGDVGRRTSFRNKESPLELLKATFRASSSPIRSRMGRESSASEER